MRDYMKVGTILGVVIAAWAGGYIPHNAEGARPAIQWRDTEDRNQKTMETFGKFIDKSEAQILAMVLDRLSGAKLQGKAALCNSAGQAFGKILAEPWAIKVMEGVPELKERVDRAVEANRGGLRIPARQKDEKRELALERVRRAELEERLKSIARRTKIPLTDPKTAADYATLTLGVAVDSYTSESMTLTLLTIVAGLNERKMLVGDEGPVGEQACAIVRAYGAKALRVQERYDTGLGTRINVLLAAIDAYKEWLRQAAAAQREHGEKPIPMVNLLRKTGMPPVIGPVQRDGLDRPFSEW
jgi:hypothetical protein